MDQGLAKILVDRLNGDQSLGSDAAVYVLAACEASGELEETISGVRPDLQEKAAAIEQGEPRRAFLKSITVQGFRGIGPAKTLPVTPGPGLTLVVGRNGSGKSSFAEALELLFTGSNRRWSSRSAVWKEDWRNLHHVGPTRVSAEMAVEGEAGATVVEHTWTDGASLTDGTTTVQFHGKQRTDLGALGWSRAMNLYRPFLSYNELGSMFDEGPTAFHDKLAAMLGLEDLVDAQKTLQQARLARERRVEEVRRAAATLAAKLHDVDDQRATDAAAALQKREWDIPAIQRILQGDGAEDEGGNVDLLRRLAAIDGPRVEEAASVIERLRGADERLAQLAATPAAEARQVARLLRDALAYHVSHADADCPVCGRKAALDTAWQTDATKKVAELEELAQEADAAHRDVEDAMRAADRLVSTPLPPALSRAEELGLPAREPIDAWARLSRSPDDGVTAMAAHIENAVPLVVAALDDLRASARAELARREDAWRPLSKELDRWLEPARDVVSEASVVRDLKAAEKWLKDAAGSIRRERFAPIAEQALELWAELRQRSSVELERVGLEGAGPSRRVALDVTIDGVEGAALGVMSQGELHSMALSLFLPRATLEESPFGFVVIDDPVQSMDPARVDGLARVLERTAKTRQVIVFTHDDRLAEAVRRLEIPAAVIGVTRREKSVVELRLELDPVIRHIEDARALALTEELPPDVAQRVVPGFCRAAIEAACYETVRRRRIGRGEPHAEVERALEDARTLTTVAALALFDDPAQGGSVLGSVNSRFGSRAGDTFKAVNKGTHQGYGGSLRDLVRDTEKLAEGVRSLK